MKKSPFYQSLNWMDHHQESYSTFQTPAEQDEMEQLARRCVRNTGSAASRISSRALPRRLSYAACMVLAVALMSQTAVGEELWKTVRRIDTGVGFAVQNVYPEPEAYYRKMEGKLFDAAGNALTLDQMKAIEAGELNIEIYDQEGQPLGKNTGEDFEASRRCFSSPEEASRYLTFSLLLPKVPEGFSPTEIYNYMDSDQEKSDYLTILYTNESGDKIHYDARLCTPETAYSIGTDGTIEQIQINGHTAVLIDGHEVMWEQDGQQLYLRGTGISSEALIEMAQSMYPVQ